MTNEHKKGFTLIELIIGITILAILAVALLAALDPVEQFAKSRDTATRNTAIELHNAVIRYAASRETYPDAFQSTDTTTHFIKASDQTTTTGGTRAITDLINVGELKSNFVGAAGTSLSKIFFINVNQNETIYTCFKPTSKQFKSTANLWEMVESNGNPTGFASPNTCAAELAANGQLSSRSKCYYCAQ